MTVVIVSAFFFRMLLGVKVVGVLEVVADLFQPVGVDVIRAL